MQVEGHQRKIHHHICHECQRDVTSETYGCTLNGETNALQGMQHGKAQCELETLQEGLHVGQVFP